MNVALPALVVFVRVLAGFLFRDRFKRSEKIDLDYAPFGRVVADAVMWAAFLHAVWLTLAWLTRDQTVRMDILLGLLSSDAIAQSRAILFLQRHADWQAQYFATLALAVHPRPARPFQLAVRAAGALS